jgi:hypothetical protein
MTNKLTVAEFILHLQTLPADLPVGRVGHYGEFHEMDTLDFSVRDARICPNGIYEYKGQYDAHVLAIEPPDIGDEPD